jgi:hypothetical protein
MRVDGVVDGQMRDDRFLIRDGRRSFGQGQMGKQVEAL